jgi:hypothetical protein
VPKKMTNVLTASTSAVAEPANRAAMIPTTAAAITPLPALASLANRIAALRSASDLTRTMAWASTQGTDTVAIVEAHRIRLWPAANLEYADTFSSRVSSNAYP